MELFILRHAEAGLDAATDFDRTLTELGKHQLSQVVGRHQEALASISQVWVSPYVRTQQTLAQIRHWLPAHVPIETTEALTPESPVRGLLPLLERSSGQRVLLVSHQPLVGEAVAKLCGLEPGAYRLGTSALTHIELPLVGFGQGRVRFCDQP
ncbi:MAG TPA: phosphohistidine phosphatase SixA [Cellvibrionaceae bacterium]|nr:phosphohistidine phosphatase SixA [Cellvibrionaceae bacterium]HMW72126.1 phosphohistidine phosphatase SixA [Cellvibrionaceae bacterium]HMY38892.1 phosphohistidine phosphatase SixA [Marinagarivorans sp.]HNG58935.1 phosphohistidine phosphatase SixA [Cellvibrionaceae bacterium]